MCGFTTRALERHNFPAEVALFANPLAACPVVDDHYLANIVLEYHGDNVSAMPFSILAKKTRQSIATSFKFLRPRMDITSTEMDYRRWELFLLLCSVTPEKLNDYAIQK